MIIIHSLQKSVHQRGKDMGGEKWICFCQQLLLLPTEILYMNSALSCEQLETKWLGL